MELKETDLCEIPKVIHYCWFGRTKLPKLARKCIASWKKFLPDYEIVEWNEDNFDINVAQYTAEAYREKRFAFVSDYARFWILYNYGGIYLDTDVELLRPINDIIATGSFMACETTPSENVPLFINPGLGMAMSKGHKLCYDMLKIYNSLHFIDHRGLHNLKTIVQYTTEYLYSQGLRGVNDIQRIKDITFYPKAVFNPYDYDKDKVIITNETRSIHHFAGSWLTVKDRLKRFIERTFGEDYLNVCVKVYQCFKFKKRDE